MEDTGYGKKIVAKIEGQSVGGTILEIGEGKKTDMAFHIDTDKIVYLLGGELKALVLKDGKMGAILLKPGASFFIKRGLVHQFEAVQASVIVEFVSDIHLYENDLNVITKGTVLEPALEPGELAKMTPEDEAKVEAVPPVKKTRARKKKPITRKKTTTKKKTTRKKTSNRKKK